MNSDRINEPSDSCTISIIIPAYNAPSELQRAIKSVLSQTFQEFEILVVDDGSDEDLEFVCNAFKDPRIRFIKNEVHRNANAARNTGIQEAKGGYLAMLDADDEFLPNHLERRIQKMEEWDCDAIFGSAIVHTQNHQAIQLSRDTREGEAMVNYLLSDGFAPTPSLFFKSSAAKLIQWDEMLERHQDFDYLVRFAEQFTLRVDFEPTVTIHWEMHEGKNFRLDSCIAFINKYRHMIDARTYAAYHRRMYYKIAPYEQKKYRTHYARESYCHVYLVSFAEFLSVHKLNMLNAVLLFPKFILMHLLSVRGLFTRSAEIRQFKNRFFKR